MRQIGLDPQRPLPQDHPRVREARDLDLYVSPSPTSNRGLAVIACPTCRGSGQADRSSLSMLDRGPACLDCGGQGYFYVREEVGERSMTIRSPSDALPLIRSYLAGLDQEGFVAVALDRRGGVIGSRLLTLGDDRSTIVSPRQVVCWALRQGRSGATSLIVAHNHPSGDPDPSKQDVSITMALSRACQTVGVVLQDHIVVADGGRWVSMAERGQIPCSMESAGWTD